MSHLARVSSLRTETARTARKSRESYPPSLPSAPVTPSSTAPTNTKLLAASICRCDPPPLVHVRNFRGVFTFPTEELAVVTLFFFLLAALQLFVRFPISVTSSLESVPVGCEAWQRAGAEARSREGLSGEWQVDSARLLYCLCYRVQTMNMCLCLWFRPSTAGRLVLLHHKSCIFNISQVKGPICESLRWKYSNATWNFHLNVKK